MPDAPLAVLATVTGGGSPTAPTVVLGEVSGGGSPTAPTLVLAERAAAVRSFEFADTENPDRDGTYVYLGEDADANPVWARDSDTVALVAESLTGAGAVFIQRNLGSPSYVWNLEESTDWENNSPTTLMYSSDGEATRIVEATPPDVDAWLDGLTDLAPEEVIFTTNDAQAVLATVTGGGSPTAPTVVLAEASGGGSPTAPTVVLAEVSGGGSPTAPTVVLAEASGGGSPTAPKAVIAPLGGWPGAVLDGGEDLTDGDGGTVTDQNP